MIYNPYISNPGQILERTGESRDLLGGILGRMKALDTDDLLVLLIVYLAVKDGNKDDMWPLLAALIYCVL